MTRSSPARIVLYVISALVLVYLILPVLIIVPISFSSARFLTFPPPSLSLRWYQQYFANAAWMQATQVTLTVAFGILPGVLAGCTMVFVLCLGFYITPELLGGGRTVMVSMLVSRNVELYNQFGAASAVAVVLLLSVLVIFFAVSRFISLDRVLGQK